MKVLKSLDGSCAYTYSQANGSLIVDHYNHTGRLKHRQSQTGIDTATATFLAISIFIILENLLVLLAVFFCIRLRSRWVYICIANITLSDLLTGTAYVLNLLMSGSNTFQLSPSLWLFREGVLFVALAASIFSLLLIAVERYTTMMKPLQQKSDKKTYRIYSLVVLCWIMAFTIGFLPLLGWNCICSKDSCSTLLPLYSKSYILISLVIFFLILLGIGVLYGSIYCHVTSSVEHGTCRARLRSLRLLKTVVSIVMAFVLCWGPLFVLLLVDFFCQSRRCHLLYMANWCVALAVFNSALNPIIYSLGSTELRRAIVCLMCGCCFPAYVPSKETESTSESLHRNSSVRSSFSRMRSLNASPPLTAKPKKPRLSSTTSCLSTSSS